MSIITMFGSFFCDLLSEVEVQAVACNLCTMEPPTNPVVTACDHYFCWPCMRQFLRGQAKPCPVCSTMLNSVVHVAPTFDTHGVLVLHLPTAEEVEPKWDDDMLDRSGTVLAPVCSEEEPIARRDVDMAAVVFDEETKLKGSRGFE